MSVRVTSVLTATSIAAVLTTLLTKKETNRVDLLEIYILAIALCQYLIVFTISDVKRVQRWRYLDWFLTTPLLLGTFYLVAKSEGFRGSFLPALIANQIMIVAGYWAEYQDTSPFYAILKERYSDEQIKYFWFFIGFIALAVVLYSVYQWNKSLQDAGKDTQFLPYFFYIGWTLYGLNFLVEDQNWRQRNFDLLDLFNKPIYTLYLAQFIDREKIKLN